MMKRKSRSWITMVAAIAVLAAMAWAFWPRPLIVDMGEVKPGHMIMTVSEEGRTRVRDAYIVSTPIAGRLLRIEVEPGDQVEAGKSVVARMLPSSPVALDIRTREQARASVSAAEAAVRAALADLNKAKADKDLATLDLERKQKLRKSGIVSQAVVEQTLVARRAAVASVDQAKAAISMRQADLVNARARLIDFSSSTDNPGAGDTTENDSIPVPAPISGRILRVLQKSEITLPAGKPILEIGDISNDLEVVTELLSTDAVRISVGDRVIIDNWGGKATLDGTVERVDPWGFPKFSALGVEEQRVNAVIKFTGKAEQRKNLGHGFRVEVQIVIWENKEALVLPSNALFREGDDWAVFTVENNRASLRTVKVGHNNGIEAEVVEGLEEGARVILYPGSGLAEGSRVSERKLN